MILKNKILSVLPIGTVEERYVKAGATFSGAISYLYLGECVGFEGLLNKWAGWEEEYT